MIVNLSGYMFTGKAALSDYLAEYRNVTRDSIRDEFDIIRMPSGLGDLMRAYESESQIAISAAINNFEKKAKLLGKPNSIIDKLFYYGSNYSERFPGYNEHIKHFLVGLDNISNVVPTPYHTQCQFPVTTLIRKLFYRALGSPSLPYEKVYYSNKKNFYSESKKLLTNLLQCAESTATHKVIHNAFEPQYPSQYFKLFGESVKCIVVDRDPRDIYATAITYSKGFNDKVSLYKRIAFANSVQSFALKYIEERRYMDSSPNVMYIKFEDLVLDYERTGERVASFLNLDKSNHVNKFSLFNPSLSEKNIGIYKKLPKSELKNIEILESIVKKH